MGKKEAKTRERVGITMDKGLLARLDEFSKQHYDAKRSTIIEEAVRKFLEGKK